MQLTDQQIAGAIHCPVANVSANWPLVRAALEKQNIASDNCQIAALATIAVETAWTFKPIREMGGGAYLQSKPYYPYFGRGFVQITWKENYEHYGRELGVDLAETPDLALNPDVAAAILAAFFAERHIPQAAEQRDWDHVRKLVNGGTNGLGPFLKCVNDLISAIHANPQDTL